MKDEARASDHVNPELTASWPGGYATTYHTGSTNVHLQRVKVEMDPLGDVRSNAQAASAILPSTSDVLTILSIGDTSSLGSADPVSDWNVLDFHWPQSDISSNAHDAQLYASSYFQDAAAAAAAHIDPPRSILTARNNNKKRAFQWALRHSIFGALPRDLQPRTMRELEYETRLRNRRPQNKKKWDKWEGPRQSYTPSFAYACCRR